MNVIEASTISHSSRRQIDSAVLGMALFLMTEAMLFAGLISACLVLRAGNIGDWPPASQPRLPQTLTLANLAVLLASGAAMAMAMARGRAKGVAISLLLGTVFFAVQGYEWSRLISFGMAGTTGPFAGIFYALIGTHALHALGGLICLLWLWRHLVARDATVGAMRACTMYWYFVVGVWPVLYLLVYV